MFYRSIVPITEPVEKVHGHLLKYLEFEYKANELFYGEMNLGHFTNVYETKDDYIRWEIAIIGDAQKMSDKYKNYSEEAENENALFNKELTKLIEIKNLGQYYAELFFLGFTP